MKPLFLFMGVGCFCAGIYCGAWVLKMDDGFAKWFVLFGAGLWLSNGVRLTQLADRP